MAWDFKPGMKVVCVDAAGFHGVLAKGSVYTVAATGIDPSDGGLMVQVIEAENPCSRSAPAFIPIPKGFAASRFRPVRTTDISSLEAHLNTLPVRTKTEA